MASTIVRLTWTLPDGTEVRSPTFTVAAGMSTLADSKFLMKLYVDKPPAVSIAPEDVDEIMAQDWGAGPMDDGHRP